MRKLDAITYYGSIAKLARTLGISRAAVSQWGALVPLATAARLEKLTHGALPLSLADYETPIPRVGRKRKAAA